MFPVSLRLRLFVKRTTSRLMYLILYFSRKFSHTPDGFSCRDRLFEIQLPSVSGESDIMIVGMFSSISIRPMRAFLPLNPIGMRYRYRLLTFLLLLFSCQLGRLDHVSVGYLVLCLRYPVTQPFLILSYS